MRRKEERPENIDSFLSNSEYQKLIRFNEWTGLIVKISSVHIGYTSMIY